MHLSQWGHHKKCSIWLNLIRRKHTMNILEPCPREMVECYHFLTSGEALCKSPLSLSFLMCNIWLIVTRSFKARKWITWHFEVSFNFELWLESRSRSCILKGPASRALCPCQKLSEANNNPLFQAFREEETEPLASVRLTSGFAVLFLN